MDRKSFRSVMPYAMPLFFWLLITACQTFNPVEPVSEMEPAAEADAAVTEAALAGEDVAGTLAMPAEQALRIRLTWMTETEENSFCFFIYRSEDPAIEPVIYNPTAPVEAHGHTQTPYKYFFYDLNVEDGKTYYYKLQLINLDGSKEWIFGDPEPLVGKPKPVTDEDRALMTEHGGTQFSIENFR